ncbi:hypothetical protein QP519_11180 [Weeksella virosa]|uniref:hypothetical protein n=1 Tax=Weeksella virosa TaxID=1014 RepID=UPI002555EB3E|nr:hypothetical protein [Weeksella virosa]MDK7376094.1 hypothetical protein [Weeksella virosa]MDK7674374.1 hypothetical protein [Weeksella virosa]
MKDFKTIKKELGLNDEKLAEIFGFKNRNSYATSSAKKRYEEAVVRLYSIIKKEQ